MSELFMVHSSLPVRRKYCTYLHANRQALECDLYVGTLNSNWNRVINELHCTWLGKCKQPYLEVGDARDWWKYGW